MATRRTNSRASTNARTEILSQLKQDHQRVKTAYCEFKNLDAEENPVECPALIKQVLDGRTVHASLEEGLIYPAARGAINGEDLIDEAQVEHDSVHALIDQLCCMDVDDEKYTTRFTVLCEYVLHHAQEDEGDDEVGGSAAALAAPHGGDARGPRRSIGTGV